MITLEGISKRFGDFAALTGIDLDVRDGEFLALLGPSGSGKTTLLRIIAGLAFPDAGRVSFNGEDVTGLKVADRKVGFVFQHYALFKHMSVADNVGFGLSVRPRRQRPRKADIRARAHELLDLVQLGPAPGALADSVRRAIGQLLTDGQANVGKVATQLGMSPRSLQRRLEAQGLRFDALLDDVRRQLAATYLAQSAQPVTSLAGLLGYASPSSFSRWFARAFGMSPLAWREERRLGGQSAVAGAASGKNGMRASNSPPSPSLKV